MTVLQGARAPWDIDRPGWLLHPLRGNLLDYWSVRVSGNWRIVFRFEDGEAVEIAPIDYR